MNDFTTALFNLPAEEIEDYHYYREEDTFHYLQSSGDS